MIGVCIKYFHENYGGMLQAYATTKILEERKIDYELIRYKKKFSLITAIKFMPRIFNSILMDGKIESYKKNKGKKEHPEFTELDEIRLKVFRNFKDKNFTKLAKESYGYKQLCQDANKYKAVITGSDQLWSPAGLPTNYYNLMFVPDNIRKISYASSFGVSQIPWYQKKRTAKFLNRIDFISMRENRGRDIVKELTGRDVPAIVDPVLMFDCNGWDKLIPVKKVMEIPYIFAYFLGKEQSYRDEVKKLSQKTGYPIVALRHMDQYVQSDEDFGDFAPYDVGPEEFLNYLRGAEYICTDSFHGTVFSIIYNKLFIVFNRYKDESKVSKNSRIESLCQNLQVQDRRYNNGDIYEAMLKSIDYDTVNRNCERYRNDANQYLDSAMTGM